MPGGAAAEGFAGGKLPEAVRQGFSDAMAQSLVLPALVLVIGLVAALLFVAPSHLQKQPATPSDGGAQPADQTT
jgi:multisubunit Na+/H+ antiporter MnhC subunit